MKQNGKQINYSIVFLNSAAKEFRKLSLEVKHSLVDPINSLSNNPFSHKSKKLKNSGLYRIRVGDYRVVYQIDQKEKIVIVTKIGHRREVYK